MKTIQFKLTDEEQSISDIVTKTPKYKHLKDPKVAYMSVINSALKDIAK